VSVFVKSRRRLFANFAILPNRASFAIIWT